MAHAPLHAEAAVVDQLLKQGKVWVVDADLKGYFDSIPQDKLMDEVLAIATRIAGNAPIAVRQAKQAIHRGLQMSLRDGLTFEIEAYNRTVPTQDRREGVLAFNEKRRPDFKGH